ncbi:MAG TPA: hypothetical protein VK066_22460 [Chloroflexota bacterium]|nr:hypothetical protein [Chloroflexota bacterium]
MSTVTLREPRPAFGARAAGGTRDLTVIAATRLEALAARAVLPRGVAVARVGMGRRARREPPTCFIACGLAGALSERLRPGAVVVPPWVGLPSGERLPCSAPLVEALAAAARRLGWEPLVAPLVTVPGLVTGRARQQWYAHGFAAADMETGWLLRQQPIGATVRVVLDTPRHDLSPRWEQPLQALWQPGLWPELAWLGLRALPYALRAAIVVRTALAPDHTRSTRPWWRGRGSDAAIRHR